MEIVKRKIDRNLSREKFDYLLSFVNEKEKKKILRYRRYEDSLRSLYGKIILKDMLNLEKVELEYNKWGQPKLMNEDKLYFNISHSGEWVAVAVDEKPVGIDIQEINKTDLDIAKSFFSKQENEYISSLPEEKRIEAFFMLWTLKEAFIKAKGRGLYISLNSFTIDISNKKPLLYNEENEECELSLERVEENYFMATCILEKSF
ncbi:4'-phosphopantetheinyl transferase family protein [Clostridium felsineum]|uniref:4'-phosphopantetheinyl transferase Sfp n=1 Tax=Clostridium felsineum TaxID=36839 RepID=A0A1S8LMM9_9CLOT|nr:4'-phosphopantetheinyl transferase superfamily protein [Clostridium felsineum]MCR3758119.1 4'-phosphopantetheinyl transferase superfamily protein [Clostridium felsineum]URZ01114.1 4'-phosphopantetheinyl transferase Sfp [Clostridium felsineum]URZ06138.1 4'-phosphopantetheinyl transferase Sfp [Clostridium felsineum]URZ11174.1 4'-phosphopantetheinyl transferase Sfp [Clostridium felsineum]